MIFSRDMPTIWAIVLLAPALEQQGAKNTMFFTPRLYIVNAENKKNRQHRG